MNVYDSARMAELLAPLGYEASDSPDNADLVLFNTCHIRENASEKLYSELGRIKPAKAEARNHGPMVVVAGCVAQAAGEEIFRRAPQVDIILGPQTYHRLPELVSASERTRMTTSRPSKTPGMIDIAFPDEPKFDALPAPKNEGPTAFLSIQEGCDKFCAFCVVPYTRGAEFSRPVASVLAEAKLLVAQGAKDIMLLGQNVNAYHGEAQTGQEWGLGRLIRALADDVEGLERIRYTTSHPRDMDEDLIAAHGEVPALMPFLHLPVQSGDDGVLKAMNRGHSRDDYRLLVEKLRKACPDLVLSSDFIAGHPGENDRAHENTLKLIADIGFAQAFSFKYSPRPGTPAAAHDDQIPEETKNKRLFEIQALLKDQQAAHYAACLGKSYPVLFERKGRYEGQLIGRTPHYFPVHVSAAESLMGQSAMVQIASVGTASLGGVLQHDPQSTSPTDPVHFDSPLATETLQERPSC